MSSNRDIYKTEKLTFASYLLASGRAELIGVDSGDFGRNVTFILAPPPSDDDIASFFNGSAQVSALRFAEAMNTLKGAAHEYWRRNG